MVKKLISNKIGRNRNFSLCTFFPKNHKGLSAIVITVILIALSMAAVILVWVFINNVIQKEITSTESCFGSFDKVNINRQYTCYDSAGDLLRFSLTVGDIKVDKIVVSVSSASSIKSYEITNETIISGLSMYSGSSPSTIILPGKNSGLTYNATGFSSAIDLVQIAPVIGGSLCEVSDSVSGIEDCTLYS